MPHAPARRITLLAAVLLALAGCGSDEGGGGGGPLGRTTTTAASPAPATTTTPASSSGRAATAPVACSTTGAADGQGTAVTVELDEWSVTPLQPTAPAGKVRFTARNTGTQPHELVVISAPSPSGLPLAADRSVDEGALQTGTLAGKVAGVAPGKRCSGTLDLEPGTYAMICNLVAGGEAHYGKGMVNVFAVS